MQNITDSVIKKALAARHIRDKIWFEVSVRGNGINRRFDAWAMPISWSQDYIGYEIKVSRVDFQNDNKWHEYLEFCNKFYFVAPTGLIKPEELDPQIGLIEYNAKNDSLRIKKRAVHRLIKDPCNVLKSILMNREESDRYPFHKSKIAFFKDWLERKSESSSIGYQVSSKLAKYINDLRQKIQVLEGETAKEDRAQKKLELINEVLFRKGIKISYWDETIDQYMEAFEKACGNGTAFGSSDITTLKIIEANVANLLRKFDKKSAND